MNRRTRLIAAAPLALAALALPACGAASAAPAPAPQLPPTAAATTTATGSGLTSKIGNSLVLLTITYSGAVYVPIDGEYEVLNPDAEVTSSCTGFFVSTEGHIATAGHCLEGLTAADRMVKNEVDALVTEGYLTRAEADANLAHYLSTWLVTGPDGTDQFSRAVQVSQQAGVPDPVLTAPQSATVVDYQPFKQGDVALVKIDGVESPPLSFATADPEPGTQVVSAGYPIEVAILNGTTEQQEASYKTGTVSSHQTSVDGVPQIEVSAEIGHGMSGGPTVDDQGRVVGINSQGDEALSFNFVTDTTDTRDWFAAHGVSSPSPDLATAEATPAPPAAAPATSNIAVLVGVATIAAAVLAALVLGFVLIIVHRRRRTTLAVPISPAVGPICPSCGQGHYPGATACAPSAASLYR